MEKSNSVGQCERCRIFKPLCLCAEIPRYTLQTRVVVIMHSRERMLTSNTARLACEALTHSELHMRGGRFPRLRRQDIVPPGHSAALLFPADDAIELNEETVARLQRPITLIVPDGSWRQARKVDTREPDLKDIPRFKLPPGPKSDFRLRQTPHAENLSTMEAIARALGILEGKAIQEGLEDLFLKMVERRLWSRGKLNASEARTGIPQEAFDAQMAAGMAGSPKSKRNTPPKQS